MVKSEIKPGVSRSESDSEVESLIDAMESVMQVRQLPILKGSLLLG